MSQKKKDSIIPGVILIAIGLWLFSRQLSLPFFYWGKIYPVFLVLFGIVLSAEFVRRRQSGSLFWGTVLALLGVFFILRNFDVIPYLYLDEYWPVFFIAAGLGFLSVFLSHPKDRSDLIPACLFLFFGIGFLIYILKEPYFGWVFFLKKTWPVILIIVGSALIYNSMVSSMNKTKKK
jgi:hypothetical protein